MNNSQTPQILLVGLPASGKTSFLAALWLYLKSDLPDKKLTQYQLSPDNAYLRRISNDWLNCKQPDRTSSDQNNINIALFLKNVSSEEKFILNVPDVAGETFKHQWELRSWTKHYFTEVKKAAGLIFFIHSQKVVSLDLLQDGYEAPQEQEEQDSNSSTEAWSPEGTTTQVILVELLQFHLEHFTRTPMPVAFVLSAWEKELEEEDGFEPAKWLEFNMPLLSQFLKANQERLQTTIYGISAQGGDFENVSKCTELRKLRQPAERIKVQVGAEHSNDISAPIQWLLSTWQSPSA